MGDADVALQSFLVKFTTHRAQLEELLVGKDNLGQQILGRYGGWKRNLDPMTKLLRQILDGLESGKNRDEIFAGMSVSGAGASSNESTSGSNWKETRSASRIKASLASAQRCAICRACLVLTHASDDRIQRRFDGGQSGQDNAQLTHHYCNHGFKEHYASLKQPIPLIAALV